MYTRLYMHICIYAYVYIYTHIYIYIYTDICVFTYIFMCWYMYTYKHIFTYLCSHRKKSELPLPGKIYVVVTFLSIAVATGFIIMLFRCASVCV